jgi:hypothetical protein
LTLHGAGGYLYSCRVVDWTTGADGHPDPHSIDGSMRVAPFAVDRTTGGRSLLANR